ncbi:MAG: hypothetical protein R3A46_19215 [Thermomicrobiales bacterium]
MPIFQIAGRWMLVAIVGIAIFSGCMGDDDDDQPTQTLVVIVPTEAVSLTGSSDPTSTLAPTSTIQSAPTVTPNNEPSPTAAASPSSIANADRNPTAAAGTAHGNARADRHADPGSAAGRSRHH